MKPSRVRKKNRKLRSGSFATLQKIMDLYLAEFEAHFLKTGKLVIYGMTEEQISARVGCHLQTTQSCNRILCKARLLRIWRECRGKGYVNHYYMLPKWRKKTFDLEKMRESGKKDPIFRDREQDFFQSINQGNHKGKKYRCQNESGIYPINNNSKRNYSSSDSALHPFRSDELLSDCLISKSRIKQSESNFRDETSRPRPLTERTSSRVGIRWNSPAEVVSPDPASLGPVLVPPGPPVSASVQRIIDSWNSCPNLRTHRNPATKALRKAILRIQVMMRGTFFNPLGDAFEKYRKNPFTEEEFIRVFQSLDEKISNLHPCSKYRRYLCSISLADFLLNKKGGPMGKVERSLFIDEYERVFPPEGKNQNARRMVHEEAGRKKESVE